MLKIPWRMWAILRCNVNCDVHQLDTNYMQCLCVALPEGLNCGRITVKGQSHEMDQAIVGMLHSSRPKLSAGAGFRIFLWLLWIDTKIINAKYGSSFPFKIPLRCVDCRWQETLELAQACCGDTFANPPANGKQAPVISLNTKSAQYGKNLKSLLARVFLRPHVISTKAGSISWDSPFKEARTSLLKLLLNSNTANTARRVPFLYYLSLLAVLLSLSR